MKLVINQEMLKRNRDSGTRREPAPSIVDITLDPAVGRWPWWRGAYPIPRLKLVIRRRRP